MAYQRLRLEFAGRIARLTLTAPRIDVTALAEQLQVEGATAFVKSWNGLMQRIADKGGALSKAAKRA